MKRLLALLILCLLIPACALALDLSAYEIPDSAECSVTLLGENRMLLRRFLSDASQPDWARLIENGAVVNQVMLPADPTLSSSHIVFAKADSTLGVIAYQNGETYGQNNGYTLYDVQDGQLAHARTLSGEPTNLIRLCDRFIGLREYEGESARFMLYDEHEQITLVGQLPYVHVYPLYSSLDGSALLLMLHCWDESNQQIMLAHITPDQQVSWQLWLPYEPVGSYSMVLPDGQDGAFLVASPEEDYRKKRLAHVSSSGVLEWEKMLCAPDCVLSIYAAVPQIDGTTALYGSAVAKSRGLYDAFATYVTPDGQLSSIDVRDFSARADIYFSCTTAPDGTPYVISERESRNCVVVPFSDLPKTENPGIRLQ